MIWQSDSNEILKTLFINELGNEWTEWANQRITMVFPKNQIGADFFFDNLERRKLKENDKSFD